MQSCCFVRVAQLVGCLCTALNQRIHFFEVVAKGFIIVSLV